MAYVSAQNQLVLFGGQTKGKALGETWRWDGKNWRSLAKTGPAARAFHGMTYSENCNNVIVFGGGANGLFTLDDTWEWDGKTWSQTSIQLPTRRGLTGMAHDSVRNQTILFGGTRTTKDWLSDTWIYSLPQTAPQVVSVDAVCGDQVVLIAFDKAISASSAQDTNHYAVACAGTLNAATKAELTDDSRIVRITTANPINGGCALFIGGIQDACGNALRAFQTGIDCRLDPCARGSAGNEYWLTFPGNYAIDPTKAPQPEVFVAGAIGTIGTVSIPGLTPVFSSPFTIPLSGIARVTLPSAADLGDAIDSVQTNAVHVIASKSVSVYGLNHLPFTSDAYLGLSTRGIGKTYIVMAYGNLLTNVPELNGTQFAIAATTDNTEVAIVPAVGVGAHPAGVVFAVTLMKGQTYQLRSTNDAPADLTGTIIVANQPIAVFGGHRAGTIPTSDVFFADHMVEQLPPTDTWGFQFLTMPLATRTLGDTFRVMALID